MCLFRGCLSYGTAPHCCATSCAGLLVIVWPTRPASLGSLSERLGYLLSVKPTASASQPLPRIDSLEKKGLAARKRAENRREYRIELTPEGQERAVEFMDTYPERTARVFSPLSHEEIRQLHEQARRLIIDYYRRK